MIDLSAIVNLTASFRAIEFEGRNATSADISFVNTSDLPDNASLLSIQEEIVLALDATSRISIIKAVFITNHTLSIDIDVSISATHAIIGLELEAILINSHTGSFKESIAI